MLNVQWPEAALAALRAMLFLVPLALAVVLGMRVERGSRQAVGALFSLLFGLPIIFVGHVLAIQLGVWRYGGGSLLLVGFPADIWFGGAMLWGPVLFLAAPSLNPWLFVLPCIALNALMLPGFAPFFITGHSWFAGVVLVFMTAHLPALYLARWTAGGTHLPYRACLLAVAYGCFAFFTMPSIIMRAMGGGWEALQGRSAWALGVAGLAMALAFIMGLSAVQMFAVHGGGTPIPLDPTKRLVRTGLYAYLSNPMQLATALGWLVLGAALGNVWVALAAVMAVCFVLGLVRWHHRQDLEVRFPEGWPEYRAHVPEWLPRWRPWVRDHAALTFDAGSAWQRRAVFLLRQLAPAGLDVQAAPGPMTYQEPHETRRFSGVAAVAKALNHGNLASALIGAGLLLAVLPLGAALGWRLRRLPLPAARRA